MRKNLIAMSAVAALGTFGLVGGAAAQMKVSTSGTGHQLIFPYFTTQGDNQTSISLVNTDTSAGKVVKVRFRGARNSDDVLDFQVLMSPGDVWTASVTQGADGRSTLSTNGDTTCTVPASVKAGSTPFQVDRVDGKNPAETREGYIEVINMADIPTAATTLFTAVKHVAATKTPPCTAATIEADLSTLGITAPTGRIAGDYIIVNNATKAAWSGSAVPLTIGTGDGTPAKRVYFRQAQTQVDPGADGPVGINGTTGKLTSDPLFGTSANTSANMVTLRQYDLPDLSTPYDPTATLSGDQLAQLMSALNTSSSMNQYETSAGVGALSDIVFTQPARRYQVAVNYTATAATANNTGTTGTSASPVYSAAGGAYTPSLNTVNSVMSGRTLCLNGVVQTTFDREETTATGAGPVVSPQTPPPLLFCGEVAVNAVNPAAGGETALLSSLTTQPVAAYTNGWLSLSYSAYGGIPFIGATFARVKNGSTQYGFTFSNKTK